MTLGKQVRLNRIFNKKSGNALIIALDHAVGWGVIPGIDTIHETMAKIIEAAPDAITMLKGTIEIKPRSGERKRKIIIIETTANELKRTERIPPTIFSCQTTLS